MEVLLFSYLETLNWFPILTPFLLDFSIGLMSSKYKLNNIFVIHRSWTTTVVLTKPSSLIVGWQDALQTITKPTWFDKTSKAFGALVKKKLILEPSQKLWRCHCALNKANPIFFLQKTKQATTYYDLEHKKKNDFLTSSMATNVVVIFEVKL